MTSRSIKGIEIVLPFGTLVELSFGETLFWRLSVQDKQNRMLCGYAQDVGRPSLAQYTSQRGLELGLARTTLCSSVASTLW